MNTMRLWFPTLAFAVSSGFAMAALWDVRWYAFAYLLLVLAYTAEAVKNHRHFKRAHELETLAAKAAAWRERTYVVESLHKAMDDGKTVDQWYREYGNYVAAHAVAEGHPVHRDGH